MLMGLGNILCSDPYGSLSYINPFCWGVWASDNSALSMQDACQKASGGNQSLYQDCVQRQTALVKGMETTDPEGARDYAGVTGSNPVGYLAGATNPDGSLNWSLSGNLTPLLLIAAVGIGVFVWADKR